MINFDKKKIVGSGVEMGTSTGELAQGGEQNTERPESGPGELGTNNNDGMEITTSALQNGKLDINFIIFFYKV